MIDHTNNVNNRVALVQAPNSDYALELFGCERAVTEYITLSEAQIKAVTDYDNSCVTKFMNMQQ
jgi:hypothetical protein